jgi:hypothetical protein
MKAEPTARSGMTNLTITVDVEILRRARIRALEEGDSVNAYLQRCLQDYVDEEARRRLAVTRLTEIMDADELHWGDRTWSRESLYER